MGRDDEAERAVDSGELLDGDDVLEVAEPRPAILRRHDDAQQAHFREPGDDLGGKAGRLVPLHDVGKHFRFRERADGAAHLLLLFGQRKIHKPS